MVGRRLDWRHGLGATALLTGALLFWVALHCYGADWYISETNADVAYTALVRFRELPYFSWVFNGGSYFLQDPQTNFYSLSTPAVLLAGPTVGLRLFEGMWGAAGVVAFALWMRRRVSIEAALVGAVAIACALGILWRIRVGNDMFLWHLGLPILLLTAERVMKERTLASALWFGLALGLMMLGPSFHSFTYLFVPVLPLFVLIEWVFEPPSPAVFLRTIGLFVLACSIGVVMISFKLAAWLAFPMDRHIGDFGIIPLRTALEQLFDYSSTQSFTVPATRFIGRVGRAVRGWDTEEGSTALPPLASILAFVGVAVGLAKKNRKTAAFAILTFALGLSITCWSPLWEGIRALNGGNFRVSQRGLWMAAFALAVFSSLGAEAVLSRLKRARAIVAGVVIASFFASVVWWTRDASRFTGLRYGDSVHATAMNPIARWRQERDAVAKLGSFKGIRPYRDERDVLEGFGYSDGFLVVGNQYNPQLYAPGKRRAAVEPSKRVLPFVVDGIAPERVDVEHLRIKIEQLPAKARVTLRMREPRFGVSVKTTPPGAKVNVHGLGDRLLIVENPSDRPVDNVVIRAVFPISVGWFVLSGGTLLGTIAALIYLGRSRRRNEHARAAEVIEPIESI